MLRPNPARERYSTVNVRDGLVTGFGGHPAPASDKAGGPPGAAQKDESGIRGGESTAEDESDAVEAPLMFTGIQILDPRVFDFIPPGVFSHSVTDVYVPAIKRGDRVAAHVASGSWYELSTVRRYLETSVTLLKRGGRDVEVGAGSSVEDGADVSESVLWEQVSVARGARVRRSVLGAGVRVGPGEVFDNVAVVRAELARGVERPEKGLQGEFRGSNFVAPIPERYNPPAPKRQKKAV